MRAQSTPAVAVWLALTCARTWLPGAHHAMLRVENVFGVPALQARGEEGAYVKDRRQLLRTGSSPAKSMKQRAIRERRNHKPQDARRFNCRLNCGPTKTYATHLEATPPSLSRALPISSLPLAALLGPASLDTRSDAPGPSPCASLLMHFHFLLSQAEPYPSERHI